MRKLLRIAAIVTMERIGSRSPGVADLVARRHPAKRALACGMSPTTAASNAMKKNLKKVLLDAFLQLRKRNANRTSFGD
jgi:hypothetical protein